MAVVAAARHGLRPCRHLQARLALGRDLGAGHLDPAGARRRSLYALLGVNRVERPRGAHAPRHGAPSRATRNSRRASPARISCRSRAWSGGSSSGRCARQRDRAAGRRRARLSRRCCEAIDGARTSIALASYIFDGDGIGANFVSALARRGQRGVEVRVLIDDVDARFSQLVGGQAAEAAGVNVARVQPAARAGAAARHEPAQPPQDPGGRRRASASPAA